MIEANDTIGKHSASAFECWEKYNYSTSMIKCQARIYINTTRATIYGVVSLAQLYRYIRDKWGQKPELRFGILGYSWYLCCCCYFVFVIFMLFFFFIAHLLLLLYFGAIMYPFWWMLFQVYSDDLKILMIRPLVCRVEEKIFYLPDCFPCQMRTYVNSL